MSERNAEEWVQFNLTAPAIISFPNLTEARAVKRNGKETGEAKFSLDVEFELDHVDVPAIKAACVKVAREKWPGRDFVSEAKEVDANGNRKMPTFLFPFKSGDKLADAAKEKSAKEGKERLREWSRGKFVLTARTKKEPKLAVVVGGAVLDLEGDARKAHSKAFYTGVEALVQVTFAPYEGVAPTGVDGVTAYLNSVVSLNRGKKLIAGGAPASEVFSGYLGKITDQNPLAGSDDLSDLGI